MKISKLSQITYVFSWVSSTVKYMIAYPEIIVINWFHGYFILINITLLYVNEFHIPVCLWGKISKTFTWIGDSTLSSISAFAELRNSRPIFWVKLSSRDCVKVLIFSFNTASTTFSFSGFSCTVRVAESLLDLPWSSQTWSN